MMPFIPLPDAPINLVILNRADRKTQVTDLREKTTQTRARA